MTNLLINIWVCPKCGKEFVARPVFFKQSNGVQ